VHIHLCCFHCSDLSQAIGPAFTKHADLRTPICIALTRLATQTRLALRAAGEPVGHADPTHSAEDDDNKGLDALLGDAEEDDVLHAHIPLGFQTQTARSTLQALRSQARNWLPLLLNSFVATPANKRGPLQAATSAYACICEPAVVAVLFRSAMTKFMKVTQQARSGELGRDAVTEGGDSDSERCSTFMEAALSLAGGLDASGIQVLYKAAVPGTKEKDPSAQKKAYKVLAYVLESRMDFAGPHFQELVCVLLEGSQTAVSAAKRYRLRCLKAAILVLVGPEGPLIDITAMSQESTIVPLGSLVEGKSPRMIAAWSVITPMVTEIVLCLKEANKRARAAAYELLVDVARALHQAEPPTTRVEHHTDHESVVALSSGGLRTLVNLVLGGLVGSTAHMVSASVMALARLLFEFAPVLAGLVPELLPAVLMLLRSRAREVIKSVLGFVKVRNK
jgi:ribosomal RNA-processing protein 12